jgi:hypothetical protein
MGVVEGSFRVFLRGAPGGTVSIQTSSDLMVWDSAGELTIPSSGEAMWSTPATGGHVYFRFL